MEETKTVEQEFIQFGETLVRSTLRGKAEYIWGQCYYYFTFGSYYNPLMMGHGKLQALNDYHLVNLEELGNAEHSWMDVVTFVISGQIRQNNKLQDNIQMEAGQFQLLKCGNEGLFQNGNNSDKDEANFIQFWIPSNKEIPEDSAYLIQKFDLEGKIKNEWQQVLASTIDQEETKLPKINQNARIYICHLEKDKEILFQSQFEAPHISIILTKGKITSGQYFFLPQDAFFYQETERSFKATTDSTVFLIETD